MLTETEQEESEAMGIEYKCVGVSGQKVLNDDEGVVETLVSVTGMTDNVKDVIRPGAYTKSLIERIPKGVWHHTWQTPVSRTEEVKELMPGDPDLPKTLPNGQPWPKDAGALKVVTRFNLDTQRGREAYSDVKFFGDQQEWSIGYRVPAGKSETKAGIRYINELDLYEYSPVLFGAMPNARTASIKDAQTAWAEVKTLKGDDAESFLMEVKSALGDDIFTTVETKDGDKPGDEDEKGERPDREEEHADPDKETKPTSVYDDDDDEEEDDDEKSAIYLSAAQKHQIETAIKALSTLLEAGTEDYDVEDEQKDLSEMVEAAGAEEAVIEAAKSFDDSSSLDEMEPHGNIILDFVEKALEENPDNDDVRAISEYIATAAKVFSEDTDAQDDTTEDTASEGAGDVDDEAKSDEQAGTVKTFTAEEWKALMSDDVYPVY